MRQTAVLSLVLAGAITSGTSAFAADPNLLNLVMPDAKVLAGVNVTSARISPLGQFVISKIGLVGQEPQQFFAATGFNPLQDVTEILAATSADPTNPGGLILASGTFSVDKITAALAGKTNLQVQSYGGAILIVATDAKANVTHAVAFFGTTLAIAGDITSVKAAIDRKTNPTSIDAALAVKVNQLSGSEDEWLISTASIAALLPAGAGAGATGPAAQVLPLFKSIQGFSGGVKFGDSVAITGEAVATTAQNASALEAVIKLGLALVSSNSAAVAKDPVLAQVIPLLQNLQVTTKDAAVDLALSIPEAQIEALVNSAQAANIKPVAATRMSK